MTVGTTNGDLSLYRGDDFVQPWGFVEEDGRVIDDLVITAASTAATSATALFTAADNEKKLTVSDGSGVADGTTMTYVSSTQVTLSAAATLTRTKVAALVRALNCSAYSAHLVSFRPSEDSTTVTLATVDTSRQSYGMFTFSLSAAQTTVLPRRGVWDWQTNGPNGVATWIKRRRWTCTKDVSHA